VIVDTWEGIVVELKAGQTMKNKVVISDSYDITQPGKYLVQVRCGVVCGGVKSNTITLTVVP
jgi:translation initiation factor 2 gamma subunit (eIF-2gamma)